MARQFWICLLVIFIFTSCDEGGKGKKGGFTGSTIKDYPEEKEYVPDIPPPPAPYTGPVKYCFEKREGDNGEDVSYLHIVLDHDSITGTLDILPYKGQPIHGTVDGISLGKVFILVYRYTQDGAEHAEQVIYKFDNGHLYLKTGKKVEQDGVLVLEAPTKALFVLYMEKVNCK